MLSGPGPGRNFVRIRPIPTLALTAVLRAEAGACALLPMDAFQRLAAVALDGVLLRARGDACRD